MSYDPQKEGAECRSCPLSGRTPVPPVRTTKRRLAIVAESPGYQEVEEQKFFVGPMGRKLRDAMNHYGVPERETHFNNALLCRSTRKLSPAESRLAIACCAPRLMKDLKRSGAKTVLTLGKQALQTMTGKASALKNWIGAPMPSACGIYTILPTINPAFAMRGNAQLLPIFYTHLDRAWELATGELPPWKWPTMFIKPTMAMVKALERVGKSDRVGFDIETAGIDPTTCPMTAIGVASKKVMVSVPWPIEKHTDKKTARAIRRALKKVLGSDVPKVAHNGVHDLLGLSREGLRLRGYRFDTILMHAVVGPTLRHDLGLACAIEFNAPRWKTEYKVYGDEKGSDRFKFANTDEDYEEKLTALLTYNAKDCYMTLCLSYALEERLKETHNGKELYQGYLRRSLIALEMRQHGILIDESRRKEHAKNIRGKRNRAKSEMRALVCRLWGDDAGQAFNPRSLHDLRKLFFQTLQITPQRYSELTKTPRVDAKILQSLIVHYDATVAATARALLRYRRWNKLLSTYVLKLPKDKDNFVHPDARVWGTISGRWSYRDPNMQNFPKSKYRMSKRKVDGRHKKILTSPGMRDMFIPRTPDGWIIEADYSQLELRIIALLSGDKLLLDAYNQGKDVHMENAKQLFNASNPSDGQRSLAKRFVYGVNYGGDSKTIWGSLVVDFPGLTLGDVDRLKDTWYQIHHYIKTWQRKNLRIARIEDYVECPLSGRRQYFHGVEEPTKVYNTPVQGTGADVIDMAIENVMPALKRLKDTYLLVQVHDALVAESTMPAATAKVLKKHMEKPVTLEGHSISFPVDFKVGKSWGTCKDYAGPEEIEKELG